MKNVTSDKRNLWMFPLGTVGRDMIYNLFTNFIFTYILFTRHLTAAQLGAVGDDVGVGHHQRPGRRLAARI